jgi:hypothetical protein
LTTREDDSLDRSLVNAIAKERQRDTRGCYKTSA